jgi:hypothetical protein
MSGRRFVGAVVGILDLPVRLFIFLVVFLINPPTKPRAERDRGWLASS